MASSSFNAFTSVFGHHVRQTFDILSFPDMVRLINWGIIASKSNACCGLMSHTNLSDWLRIELPLPKNFHLYHMSMWYPKLPHSGIQVKFVKTCLDHVQTPQLVKLDPIFDKMMIQGSSIIPSCNAWMPSTMWRASAYPHIFCLPPYLLQGVWFLHCRNKARKWPAATS